MHKQDRNNCFFLLGLWVAVELLVNPVGNFPLNDDWAYAYTVKMLLTKGVFLLSDWTATNLISQAFWGALFCLPFGFTFTALRISTVLLAFIGLISTYFLFRESDADPKFCLLATLVIAVNPVYLALSNTFMNDVPFLSFAVITCLLMIRALKTNSWLWTTIAILASCVSVLARQTGLAISLAFCFAWIFRKAEKSFSKAMIAMGVPVAAELIYIQWLQRTGAASFFMGDQIDTIFAEISAGFFRIVVNFGQITIYSMIYLGIFLAPFLLPFHRFIFKKGNSIEQKANRFIPAITLILFMVLFGWQQKLMPFFGNILVDFGIGPLGLENTYQPKAPALFWLLLTCLGLFSAVFLIRLLISFTRSTLDNRGADGSDSNYFVLLCFVFLFLPLTGLGTSWRGMYDRYLLPLLPFALFAGLSFLKNIEPSSLQRRATVGAFALLIVYGGFSVAGVHDYLAANRVVWNGLHELMENDRVSPQQIRGGFEFYGWYLCKDRNRTSRKKEIAFACLWNNEQADYVLSFLPIDGYREIRRYRVSTWLTTGKANVYVLRKNPELSMQN